MVGYFQFFYVSRRQPTYPCWRWWFYNYVFQCQFFCWMFYFGCLYLGKVRWPNRLERKTFFFYFGVLFFVLSITESGATCSVVYGMQQPPNTCNNCSDGLGRIACDASGWTSRDRSRWTLGDTSIWTSGDTSRWTSGGRSGWISGDTFGWTSGDRSGWTSRDTSGWT